MDAESRITELEIKLSYTEDLLDELNLVLYRQQQQIDAMARQLAQLQLQQAPEAGMSARSPQDELPPHY